MEIGQNRTGNIKSTGVIKQQIDPQYQALIDFKALGGIITDENGNIKNLTMDHLADMLGVVRSTLYEWMKRPGFWDEVNTSRQRLSNRSRLAKMNDVWYVKALSMKDWRITEAWLRNYDPNYREPKQKIEHELGNSWAALLQASRKQNAIDAEIIDESGKD